jgi:hypothetical protein
MGREYALVGKPNFLPLYRHVVEAMLEARLNGSEYRALMLIVLEHLKQGGKENGNLIVTQENFIKAGRIDHASVAGAIRGLKAKSLIDFKGGEYNPGTGRRNHLAFTLNILTGKSLYRNISVPCQTEKPHKVQTENPHYTQTENPHYGVQTENPHNYLDLDLPYPPNAVGPPCPDHALAPAQGMPPSATDHPTDTGKFTRLASGALVRMPNVAPSPSAVNEAWLERAYGGKDNLTAARKWPK